MRRETAALLAAACLLTGCGPAAKTTGAAPAPTETASSTDEPAFTITEEEKTMTVTIGEKSCTLILEDNDTARAFRELCPVTLDMQELNGNEKYIYLDDALPSASRSVREIHAGDVMLFGSSCVVLFYESFSTSYSYTPIGRLSNTEGLREAVGTGSVLVDFK